MLTTTYRGESSELGNDFLERIKAMFKGKRIEVFITETDEEEMDETEYLLRDPANRKHLLDAHARVQCREGLVEVEIDSL